MSGLAPPIRTFLFHSCDVTPATGESNSGDPTFGTIRYNVPCQLIKKSLELSVKNGKTELSRAQLFFEGDTPITPESKINFQNTEYRVIFSDDVWGDDPDTPHHYKVWVA